jgi:hypothetical protein
VGRCIGLTSLPPSVSRLPRQCGILNISQRPLKGIALLLTRARLCAVLIEALAPEGFEHVVGCACQLFSSEEHVLNGHHTDE